ncbi:MAG: precorrin-6Y C5,15-methyltransferase (decarboxylating) subunit CbiT [Methanocorpusculum sp.]|uniref:precorrin-6Y C5,15-methyltransferase (decarboxylating) subunit CbiT n=1 Tax=Methanocorpusculum sp. TaxID=2058474 RepID=UPI002728BC43|nr:precorrin-6Y C5,15-methyltransferase (decarboxylating) subunit CbiT [Methanocorpusculum sp.]MDO9523753.1 precorrin-6Y C5,15-methyltransferase (decarboxylating) subunit CbiT [Methanocorpusculum sp.]
MDLPGGPTQPEVMAVSLAKLAILPGDTVVDIGCGTGTVTLEMAKLAGDDGHVYAVDRRQQAVECTQETCRGVDVEIFAGEALDFLASPHKPIDCAFLGGSRNIREILTYLQKEGTRSIVVNAVLLETAVETIHTMKELDMFIEAVHLQVSRSHNLMERIMFQPINPIFIIHGGRKC